MWAVDVSAVMLLDAGGRKCAEEKVEREGVYGACGVGKSRGGSLDTVDGADFSRQT